MYIDLDIKFSVKFSVKFNMSHCWRWCIYMEEAPFHSTTPKNIRYMTHLVTYIIVLIIFNYIMRYHQLENYSVFTFSLITQKVVEQFSKS